MCSTGRAPSARQRRAAPRSSHSACAGLGDEVERGPILGETVKNLYDGVPIDEVLQVRDPVGARADRAGPAYSQVTARLLLHTVRREVLGEEVAQGAMAERYAEYFPRYLRQGIARRAARRAAGAVRSAAPGRRADRPDRDLQFVYLGLQTLYDRYFLHIDERRIELPQVFFMRVAMGLALGRNRPRGARDRVLRPALELRLHELDADAVQFGHAALAAIVLLPDHGVRRPRRHLRGDQGERAARQVSPADSAMTGRRCERSAATSGAPTARARASCRS